MLLIPAAAAMVFTLIFCFSEEPRLRSKIILVGWLLVGISLQFAAGYLVAWILGLLVNVGVAIFGAFHLQFGS